jgi:hypothetical protein
LVFVSNGFPVLFFGLFLFLDHQLMQSARFDPEPFGQHTPANSLAMQSGDVVNRFAALSGQHREILDLSKRVPFFGQKIDLPFLQGVALLELKPDLFRPIGGSSQVVGLVQLPVNQIISGLEPGGGVRTGRAADRDQGQESKNDHCLFHHFTSIFSIAFVFWRLNL